MSQGTLVLIPLPKISKYSLKFIIPYTVPLIPRSQLENMKTTNAMNHSKINEHMGMEA